MARTPGHISDDCSVRPYPTRTHLVASKEIERRQRQRANHLDRSGQMMTSSLRPDIITAVKNRFKHLYYQASFDRLIIMLACIALVIALISTGQLRTVSIGTFSILLVILFIRLFIYSFRSRHKVNPDCPSGREAMSLMAKLVNEMNIKLHPTKSLEIAAEFRGASSAPRPFLSGCKVHFGGRVRIGCIILYGLDNLALNGVLAHEFAHLKKRHFVKGLPFPLLFTVVLVYWIVSGPTPIIPILLTFAIGALILSLVSWYHEYEADAVAAEYVGKKDMAYALEQVAGIMHRPGDTLTHPSFGKRISHLLSEEW